MAFGPSRGEQLANDHSPLIMFWNLENLFDYFDDAENEADNTFLPEGERHWSAYKFYRKCNMIAKSILWISDKYSQMPDVIGLCEIENSFVLRAILRTDALKKHDYDLVHFESSDHRGIDVGLLYRKSKFKLKRAKSYEIKDFSTRNILYVSLLSQENEEYHFLVNHHPSKYGGEKESIPKRREVLDKMNAVVDSLIGVGASRIVSMGDFNEFATNDIFLDTQKRLFNKGEDLQRRGKGSIKYKGRWDMIDNFFVSKVFEDYGMEVVSLPFAVERDSQYSGEKPKRTYVHTIYKGGISDHLPIIILK